VRGLRAAAASRIEEERACAPFASLQDFVDRTGLKRDEQRMLAEVGALNAFGLTRRSALWQVEKAGRPRGPLFRDAELDEEASPVPEMGFSERLTSDLAGTGLSVGRHPVSLFRQELEGRGVRRASELSGLADGDFVRVAGAVICRQRPGTAKGFVFLTLEDETGLVNITVRPDLFETHGQVVVTSEVLEVDGILQTQGGVSVRATDVRRPVLPRLGTASRDFH
jgi:error-prone DNA polymerase